MTFPFIRGGYRHVLLREHGPWRLVERTWIEDGRPHLPHYELVRLQTRRARRLPNGAWTPAGDAYPEPSKWGQAGWSEPTLAHALRRAEQLCPEAGWHTDTALLNTPSTWRPLSAQERRQG